MPRVGVCLLFPMVLLRGRDRHPPAAISATIFFLNLFLISERFDAVKNVSVIGLSLSFEKENSEYNSSTVLVYYTSILFIFQRS